VAGKWNFEGNTSGEDRVGKRWLRVSSLASMEEAVRWNIKVSKEIDLTSLWEMARNLTPCALKASIPSRQSRTERAVQFPHEDGIKPAKCSLLH
jgi:hypothetical protein